VDTKTLTDILGVAIPVIVAITFHEAAHGWVAWRLGDDTAKRMGRVTFNPIRHIDPVGSVVLPLLLYLTTGFAFGWAKPVPVAFHRLNNPRRDMVWVALAGPGINLVLLIASGLALCLFPQTGGAAWMWAAQTLVNSIAINTVLMLFNMIPLPPLDGGRVAVGLLPLPMARVLAQAQRFGMFALIGILVVIPLIGNQFGYNLNVLGWIIGPPVGWVIDLFLRLAGFA